MGKHYKILCINSGEIFENSLEASKALHVNSSTISYHLNGRLKTVKGLILVRLTGTETEEDIKRMREVHLKRFYNIDASGLGV